MRIRQIEPDAIQDLRAIRLRALTESLEAFGARVDDERQREDAWWRDWLVAGVVFVAEDETGWHGLTAARPDLEDPSIVHVLSMWVAPERRQHGIGRRLLDAAVDWSRRAHARTVRLGVAESNDAAWSLYRQAGFSPTGEREPLYSDPTREVRYVELALS